MDDGYFEQKKEKARQIYDTQRTIYSPFFKQETILNADGVNHLQRSMRTERNREYPCLERHAVLPSTTK
jgi:hypothetical protein